MDILIYGTTEMSYLVASRLRQQHNSTLLHESGQLSDKFCSLDTGIVEGSGGDLAVLEKIETKKQACSLPAPHGSPDTFADFCLDAGL